MKKMNGISHKKEGVIAKWNKVDAYSHNEQIKSGLHCF